MTDLYALLDPFPSAGQSLSGSPMSDEEALHYARKNHPSESFCLVRNWIWLDLDAPTEILQKIQTTQRKPAIIYADKVIYDSKRRWDADDFVRTSLLQRFTDGFLFRTLNTTYILLGPGQRKRTNINNVANVLPNLHIHIKSPKV